MKKSESAENNTGKKLFWIKNGIWILCSLFLIMGLSCLLFRWPISVDHLGSHQTPQKPALSPFFNRTTDHQKVHKYLNDVESQSRLHKSSLQLENKYFAPEITEPSIRPSQNKETSSLSSVAPPLDQENLPLEYLKRERHKPTTSDIDASVQSEIQQRQDLEEMNQIYQQQYIREFQKKAERDGINVEFDKKYRVKKASPLVPHQ